MAQILLQYIGIFFLGVTVVVALFFRIAGDHDSEDRAATVWLAVLTLPILIGFSILAFVASAQLTS